MRGARSASTASPRPPAVCTPRASSRREPRDRPSAARARVGDAIVQPAHAALPELEVVGDEAIAAPVRRARRRLAVLLPQRLPAFFEPAAALDRLALRRGPSADARAER